MHALCSALTLLVLGVLADAHHFAVALDDLALLAHGLYAGTHFHGIPSLLLGCGLLGPPGDAAPRQVIG